VVPRTRLLAKRVVAIETVKQGKPRSERGTSGNRGQRGFSLVELLILVLIILIIAAISIPSFSRARISANEASAVSSVRHINTAEGTYSSSRGAALRSSLGKPWRARPLLRRHGGGLSARPSFEHRNFHQKRLCLQCRRDKPGREWRTKRIRSEFHPSDAPDHRSARFLLGCFWRD